MRRTASYLVERSSGDGFDYFVALFHVFMSDVTRILSQIQSGDRGASDQLLPLVYEELRRLAAARLANEQPGQALQATALVHGAYLRLVDVEEAQEWGSRGHFFAAAAEAMRRILVERARQKKAEKYGGHLQRVELGENDLLTRSEPDEILALDDALSTLAAEEPEAADPVKLRASPPSPKGKELELVAVGDTLLKILKINR